MFLFLKTFIYIKIAKKTTLSIVEIGNIYFLSLKLALDFQTYSFINYLIIVSVLIVS
jgi:hypothetical protein